MSVLEELRNLPEEPCAPAVDWVGQHAELTREQLWATCPMGSWMLWYLE